jgi:peroxiredoxin
MAPLRPGAAAPRIAGVDLSSRPAALFFYKVTCPVCRMSAPKATALERAYPGSMTGIGQDPVAGLEAFSREHGLGFGSIADAPPYPVSDAYGIEVVPTLFVIDDSGMVADAVESWDRAGYERASRALAGLTGAPYVEVSNANDGLPPFRPG